MQELEGIELICLRMTFIKTKKGEQMNKGRLLFLQHAVVLWKSLSQEVMNIKSCPQEVRTGVGKLNCPNLANYKCSGTSSSAKPKVWDGWTLREYVCHIPVIFLLVSDAWNRAWTTDFWPWHCSLPVPNILWFHDYELNFHSTDWPETASLPVLTTIAGISFILNPPQFLVQF